MYTKRVINDIETYYSRYCESISDQMLYYSTMHFVSYLYSYSIVKDILLNLKKECPYNKETIEDYNKLDGFDVIKRVAQDKKCYISYVLHYLDYSFASNSIVDFYDDAAWICYVKKIIVSKKE